MSQGNDYANYSASADDTNAPTEDVWFVAVASDDIQQMSLDQLDEALNAGLISAETAVWQEGMDAWATLGEVAGLDDDDADEAETSIAGTDYVAAGHGGADQSGFKPAAQAGGVQGGINYAAYSSQPSIVPAQPSVAPGQSSLAPVAGSIGGAPFMQSTVPVALNVDEDMPPIRRGRRFRPERWLLAVAGVAAAGVTLYNNDVFTSADATASQAAVSAPKALAARPYEPAGVDKGTELETSKSAVVPVEPTEAEGDAPIGRAASGASKADDAKVVDDAKVEADAPEKNLRSGFSKAFKKKPVAKKAKARKRSRTAPRRRAARRAPTKKSKVKRAASAFDPLNGSLP